MNLAVAIGCPTMANPYRFTALPKHTTAQTDKTYEMDTCSVRELPHYLSSVA